MLRFPSRIGRQDGAGLDRTLGRGVRARELLWLRRGDYGERLSNLARFFWCRLGTEAKSKTFSSLHFIVTTGKENMAWLNAPAAARRATAGADSEAI